MASPPASAYFLQVWIREGLPSGWRYEEVAMGTFWAAAWLGIAILTALRLPGSLTRRLSEEREG